MPYVHIVSEKFHINLDIKTYRRASMYIGKRVGINVIA